VFNLNTLFDPSFLLTTGYCPRAYYPRGIHPRGAVKVWSLQQLSCQTQMSVHECHDDDVNKNAISMKARGVCRRAPRQNTAWCTCSVCMRRGDHRQVPWTTETTASMHVAAAAASNRSRRLPVVLHLTRRLDLHVASVISGCRRDRLPPDCLSVGTHSGGQPTLTVVDTSKLAFH